MTRKALAAAQSRREMVVAFGVEWARRRSLRIFRIRRERLPVSGFSSQGIPGARAVYRRAQPLRSVGRGDPMRPSSASSTSRRPVVLLVLQARDDASDMYAAYLRYHGLVPIAVSTAREARERARHADVLVTDIILDGQADGIELVSRLRNSDSTRCTPMIVLTACSSPEDRERAARAGCDAFLPKPCLPDQLLREVRRLLQCAPTIPRPERSVDDAHTRAGTL